MASAHARGDSWAAVDGLPEKFQQLVEVVQSLAEAQRRQEGVEW
ncbi:MAG: hypothetical protein ACK4ME_04555 [Fimbriimonadales bacterium]